MSTDALGVPGEHRQNKHPVIPIVHRAQNHSPPNPHVKPPQRHRPHTRPSPLLFHPLPYRGEGRVRVYLPAPSAFKPPGEGHCEADRTNHFRTPIYTRISYSQPSLRSHQQRMSSSILKVTKSSFSLQTKDVAWLNQKLAPNHYYHLIQQSMIRQAPHTLRACTPVYSPKAQGPPYGLQSSKMGLHPRSFWQSLFEPIWVARKIF